MRRVQYQAADGETESEDGPFVSFTDLLSGILFIFLILIAALMLMQRDNVESARRTAEGTVTIGNKQMTAKELYEFALKFAMAQAQKINQLQQANDALTAQRSEAYRPEMVYNVYEDHRASNGDTSGRLYYNHSSTSFLSLDRTKILFQQQYYTGLSSDSTRYGGDGEQPPMTRAQTDAMMAPCDVQTMTRQHISYVCSDGLHVDLTRVAPDRYAGMFRTPGKIVTRFELRILAIYDEELR